MKLKSNIIAILSFILYINTTAHAQNKCVEIFQIPNAIISQLENSSVAIGSVDIYGKKIPTILVNKQSVDSLKTIYNQSIGIVVAHQKGYKNDHGLLRLGDYFIDRDIPGFRNRGEINSTGLSWAPVKEYTQYTFGNQGSYNRVEVLFELSPSEYQVAMIYQKMRRAAIIRPDFTFGGDNNPKDVNNRLSDCGEICFSFSTGSATRSQEQSIRRKIQSYNITHVDTFMKSDDIIVYVNLIRSHLQNSGLSGIELHPNLSHRFETPISVKNLNLDQNAQIDLLNWIIGLQITMEYRQLLEKLEINNSSDYSSARSSRASAVLIYDGKTSKEDFLKSEYKSEGVFSTWTNKGLTIIQDGQTQGWGIDRIVDLFR